MVLYAAAMGHLSTTGRSEVTTPEALPLFLLALSTVIAGRELLRGRDSVETDAT